MFGRVNPAPTIFFAECPILPYCALFFGFLEGPDLCTVYVYRLFVVQIRALVRIFDKVFGINRFLLL